jgi:uncharacterized protein (DUF1499 family)
MTDEVVDEVAMPAAETSPPADGSNTDTVTTLARPKDWTGRLVLTMASASALWGLVAAVGTGWRLWSWQSGIDGLRYSFFMALAALLLGLLVAWAARKRGSGGPRAIRLLGIAVALAYAGWMLSWYYSYRSVPAIHDISTDLADPPQFRMLELRKDNLDNIPGKNDAAMKALTPQQRWETLHRNAYADIRRVRINEPMADVIAKAERIARTRGWDVATADPVEGRLEATETRTLFRIKDDIVLRVRPTEDGAGSVVDMRSVSRIGNSDLGANADRIRKFLADLAGTVSAG